MSHSRKDVALAEVVDFLQVFRFFGFSFFYSKEHDPLHVHVEGNGGMAKFEWNERHTAAELHQRFQKAFRGKRESYPRTHSQPGARIDGC